MEVSIVAEKVNVYERADEDYPIIGELLHGDRVDIGKYTYRRAWLEVFLAGKRKAFIRGSTALRAEPMQHHIIIEQPWQLLAERLKDAPVVATIPVGQLVAVGAITTIPTGTWIEVAMQDGTIGYVIANSKAQRIRWSWLSQSKVAIRKAPESNAPILKTLGEHEILGVGPVTETPAGHWARILLPDGTDGFMPADTQIRRLDVLHAETKLPIAPGKCLNCGQGESIKLAAYHLADRTSDEIRGVCLVPVCDACIGSVSYKLVVLLCLIGIVSAAISIVLGYYFIGVLGFFPISLYILNIWQTRGRAIRYRHIAEDASYPRLAQFNVEPTEVTDDEITDITANWVRFEKIVFCPGCLQMHTAQAPWCPHCNYLMNYRIYPRS